MKQHYETIEARAIPVLKAIGKSCRDQSNMLNDEAKKKEENEAKRFLKKSLSGIVTKRWIDSAKTDVWRGSIKATKGNVQVSVDRPESDKIEYGYNDEQKQAIKLCTKSAHIYSIVTHTGKLRKLASYMRTNCGKTKAVLALPDSKFRALIKRYVEDLTADHSCRI